MLKGIQARVKAHVGSRKHLEEQRNDLPPIPGNHPIQIGPTTAPPTSQDIYRHRKQYGVNIGAGFVGERWISDKQYACCDGHSASELSAVESYAKANGIEKTRQTWEAHWNEWFTSKDIDYLVQHGINTIRLPIGYYSLSRSDVLEHTDFQRYAAVYVNSWNCIKHIISECAARNVGVLLDMHCLPGGQNKDAHSGTDHKDEKFWTDSHCRSQALKSIQWLIDMACTMENVVGVQAMNEPSWGKIEILQPFYDACLQYASRRGNLPIYIGDGWKLDFWADWAGKREEFCVVDHHYYYCFADHDHMLSPQQHVQSIQESNELETCSKMARGNLVVGEWSLALDPSSKALSADASQDRKLFGAAQLKKYMNHCGGCFFWTYKFQVRNNDNDWDIRDMLDFGFLQSPLQNSLVPLGIAHQRETSEKMCAEKLQEHTEYWSRFGGNYEHWRYEEGFRLGWSDAASFAALNSSLGYKEEWQKKRRAAHIHEKGISQNIWEFDAGFSAGVRGLEGTWE